MIRVVSLGFDEIVQANLDWFFTTGRKEYTDARGNTAYSWPYTLPGTTGEDAEEGQWDVDGFYRLWVSGRYRFPTSQMLPFANTFVDLMTLAPAFLCGRVDTLAAAADTPPTPSQFTKDGYFWQSFDPMPITA